jgi:nitroreductase
MDSINPNPAIIAAIRDRRTIKEFRSDPIPEETLWRILDSARWAPNHRLTEPWRIAIIGTQSREALADALAGQMTATQDPSVLAKAKDEARRKVMSSPVLLAVTCPLAGHPAQEAEDLAAVCAAVQNLQIGGLGRGNRNPLEYRPGYSATRNGCFVGAIKARRTTRRVRLSRLSSANSGGTEKAADSGFREKPALNREWTRMDANKRGKNSTADERR